MFHAAKALLSIKDHHPKTHNGLISEFGLQFIASGSIEEFYGKMLAVAEDEREKADYDVYYKASQEETEAIIEDAENFLERIKKSDKYAGISLILDFFTNIYRIYNI